MVWKVWGCHCEAALHGMARRFMPPQTGNTGAFCVRHMSMAVTPRGAAGPVTGKAIQEPAGPAGSRVSAMQLYCCQRQRTGPTNIGPCTWARRPRLRTLRKRMPVRTPSLPTCSHYV